MTRKMSRAIWNTEHAEISCLRHAGDAEGKPIELLVGRIPLSLEEATEVAESLLSAIEWGRKVTFGDDDS